MAAVSIAVGCEDPPMPMMALPGALPSAMHAEAVPVSRFLGPTARGAAGGMELCAWARGADVGDRQLARWIDEGRLTWMVVTIDEQGANIGGDRDLEQALGHGLGLMFTCGSARRTDVLVAVGRDVPAGLVLETLVTLVQPAVRTVWISVDDALPGQPQVATFTADPRENLAVGLVGSSPVVLSESAEKPSPHSPDLDTERTSWGSPPIPPPPPPPTRARSGASDLHDRTVAHASDSYDWSVAEAQDGLRQAVGRLRPTCVKVLAGDDDTWPEIVDAVDVALGSGAPHVAVLTSDQTDIPLPAKHAARPAIGSSSPLGTTTAALRLTFAARDAGAACWAGPRYDFWR